MKKIEYKYQIAWLLACLTLLIVGACSLYQNGGINYVSITASMINVVPAVLVMFLMGWLIGSMMEGSKSLKKANSMNYANSLLEEIMREEGLDNYDLSSPANQLTEQEQIELENLTTQSKNKKSEDEDKDE